MKHRFRTTGRECQGTPTVIGVGDAEVEDGGSRGQVLHQGSAVGGHAKHGRVVIHVQDVEVHPDGRGLASPILSTDGEDVILLGLIVQGPGEVEDAGDGIQEEDSLLIILAYGVRDLPVDARVVVGGKDGCHQGTCVAQEQSTIRHLQQARASSASSRCTDERFPPRETEASTLSE